MSATAEAIKEKQADPDYSPLDAFGLEVAKKRREAIDGRQQLGIEEEWEEDEEAYVGVDDANREEYKSTWRRLKPSAAGKPFSTEDRKNRSSNKATAFLNITRPYVDAAAARLADMLLPNDDKCWGIEPTPLPTLRDDAQRQAMVTISADLQVTREEFHQVVEEVATERAERAEEQLEDWFAEGKWQHAARGVIEDAARIGTGVLKGPFPRKKRRVGWTMQGGAAKKQVSFEVMPQSAVVDPWNFFPDPSCGEDIQDGNYVFERDSITEKRLLGLIGTPGYIEGQIKKCIEEGPIKPELNWTPAMQVERTAGMQKEPFEIWYFYGMATREELESANMDITGLEGNRFSAIITMVNHRVIKATLNPLDDGTFPYDVMVWQKRPGMPWGIGVSRQVRTPQRMLNAGNRNMLDNAALSGGPQVVINSNAIVPLDGNWEITPRKAWKAKEGADVEDVEKAFRVFSIETRQVELLNIINFALRMAEESTGLPMILQGQMGNKAPDTVGGMQMLQNNASSVLRRLAKMFDETITVPHVNRYYHWLMEYGEDDSMKGDYQIIARGSSTLVERDLQNQELSMMVQLAGNPVYELDPAKTAEEYLRSRRFDPERFKPDEQSAMNQPQPPDPKLQAAEIKSETDQAIKAAEIEDNERDRQHEMEQKAMDILNDRQLFDAERDLKQEHGSGI